MKPTGYQLTAQLREVADATANPERAQLMEWAANEIESLILEIKSLENQIIKQTL
tara:strand:- start:9 stop:173 length:165 start_codon:yes stop_codon:yes gene_type:complete